MLLFLFRNLFILLLSIIFLASPRAAEAGNALQEYNGDRPTHTVEPGETLFALSRMYEVEVSQLREWNELESDNLQPGQELFVGPEEQTDASPEEEREYVYHTVQQGETLFALSRRFEVERAQLMEWNNLENPSLQIGQELIVGEATDNVSANGQQTQQEPEEEEISAIPPPEAAGEDENGNGAYALEEAGPAYQYYEVKAGDTLSGISRQFGTPVGRLREMNELESNALSIGQRLIVGREERAAAGLTGIAVESTAQGRFYTYEFGEGDDMQTLLEQHEMNSLDFEVLNPGLPPASVTPGQQLVLLAPPTSARKNPYVQTSAAAASDAGQNLMRATVYAAGEQGKTTTTGELYNPEDLTAAHPSLSLGSVVFVENAARPRGVFVLINDRTSDSRLKLSRKAFEHLELDTSETAEVLVQTRLDP